MFVIYSEYYIQIPLDTLFLKKKPKLNAAHLDFFLVSADLARMVGNIDMETTPLSDHSVVKLRVKMTDFAQGPGLWKFNTSLLNDEKITNGIRKLIENMKSNFTHMSKW